MKEEARNSDNVSRLRPRSGEAPRETVEEITSVQTRLIRAINDHFATDAMIPDRRGMYERVAAISNTNVNDSVVTAFKWVRQIGSDAAQTVLQRRFIQKVDQLLAELEAHKNTTEPAQFLDYVLRRMSPLFETTVTTSHALPNEENGGS